MTYERDEYMRRQEAEHAMIAMRDPRKALNQIAGMPWASGRPSPADACTEMQAIARTASDEMRADENAWPERAIRVAEALEHEVVSMRGDSLWCRLCAQDIGADGQDHAAHCVLSNKDA